MLQVSNTVSYTLIPTTQETLTNVDLQWDLCYIIPSIDQLAFYSAVYYHIVYYGGRVYGHDGGYEGDNLTSKIT